MRNIRANPKSVSAFRCNSILVELILANSNVLDMDILIKEAD